MTVNCLQRQHTAHMSKPHLIVLKVIKAADLIQENTYLFYFCYLINCSQYTSAADKISN